MSAMSINPYAVNYNPYVPAQLESQPFSIAEKFQNIDWIRWSGYAATISLIAAAIIFSPSSAIGIPYAFGCLLVKGLIIHLIFEKPEIKIKTHEEIQNLQQTEPVFEFFISTVVPIFEEVIFRGVLQPLLSSGASYILPIITLELVGGIQLTLASLIAIVATSIIFAATHLDRDPSIVHFVAIDTAVASIGLGILATQYGLLSSIVAHMIHNTFVTIVVPSDLYAPK